MFVAAVSNTVVSVDGLTTGPNPDILLNMADRIVAASASVSGTISPEGEIIPVVFEAEAYLSTPTYQGDVPTYQGDYEITPATHAQTLQTSNKLMAHNVVIDPIPNCYGLITWTGAVLTVT